MCFLHKEDNNKFGIVNSILEIDEYYLTDSNNYIDIPAEFTN